MFDMFSKKQVLSLDEGDFSYLEEGTYYFDSSCQTLRPRTVLAAQKEYFEKYNACGGRVKYDWGIKVDREVGDTRSAILKYLGLSAKEYFVAFTQSTTYAINLVLSQLRADSFKGITTTDREHNSVFLPSISYATQKQWSRTVISRKDDGEVALSEIPETNSIFIANVVSNIDGQKLQNIQEVATKVHKHGGIVILDAAQAMTDAEFLKKIDYDVLCFSGHKVYGPSIGVIVMKKSVLPLLDFHFVGGGMVSDVQKDTYELISDKEEPWALLEPGLQDWGGIIGLKAAVEWLITQKKDSLESVRSALLAGLDSLPVTCMTAPNSAIVSIYSDTMDSHRAAQALATQGIMVRSGYFCCHYFLKHVKKLPPLLRISLGYHNTEEEVRYLISRLSTLYNPR